MPAYSTTPLAKKLGVKKGNVIFLYNEPIDYFNRLEIIEGDYKIVTDPEEASVDFIHVFVSQRNDLESIANPCKMWLKKSGMLWVSWPKGSSKINTDLKREPIREYVLSIGLVDVKVASFDDDWSGLKFVWRLKDR